MKRLIALAIALMLLTMPALAELWYTDNITSDGSPIYYFEDFSMTLPADWAGKVTVVTGESGGVSFYQKASYERNGEQGQEGDGFLFMVGASVNDDFADILPAFEYLGFSEASAMNYYLQLPTDYRADVDDEAVRAEYDAMLAQVEEIAAGVEFYPEDADGVDTFDDAEEPDVADAASEADAAEGPTLEQARYFFEHDLLPRYFYEVPQDMLDTVGEVGIFQLWTAIAGENGIAYPYQASDYWQRYFDTADGATILQIGMPEPDGNTLCYRVYMVYNAETGTAGYYTIESDTFSPDTAFVCGWDANGTHYNYGGMDVLDPAAADFEEQLMNETQIIADIAGVSTELTERE